MDTRIIDLPLGEIIRLYESGMSTTELGNKFGVSYQTIIRRLNRAGVNVRKVGVVRKFDLDEIIGLYNSGMSSNAIDEYLGCSHGVASRYLRGVGIKPGKGNKLQNPVERVCPECSRTFETIYRDKRYCSRACQGARLARLRDDRKRANADGRIDDISLIELYERDGGICHICGGMTDWNDCRHDENGYFIAGLDYPSRDHVIPIARGGAHTWDNVKLAHFHCNSAKGSKVMEVMANA